MKTETALRKAKGKSALGRLLGIDRRSIQKWGEDIPPKREEQLRGLKPEWFRTARK